MNLALSIFDVFTYAIPGSIYSAGLIYISNRLDWIRLEANNLNTTILFVGAVLASYLLGHITYQLGRSVERILPIWKQGLPDPKQVFLSDVPKSEGEFLARLNPHLLLAAVEVRTKEAAVEINRLRAIGLMLRIAFLRFFSLPQFQSLKS